MEKTGLRTVFFWFVVQTTFFIPNYPTFLANTCEKRDNKYVQKPFGPLLSNL